MDDPAEMHAFRPIQVGTMQLDHRLVVPPHAGGGRLLESDELFERHCAYWLARVKGGMQWVGGEPVAGSLTHSLFVERMGEYFDRLHAANGFGTVQFQLQEIATDLLEPVVLAAEAGADAIELHAVSDHRLREVLETIRSTIDRPITLGVRLSVGQMVETGAQLADVQRLIASLSTEGTVDYFSLDVGGDLDMDSHIPAGMYDEGALAELCGQAKQATHLPVVYVGRALDIAAAERVLTGGHADLVALTRAGIADPDVVSRTRRGEVDLVRPCIGVNDCADRRAVDGRFVCAVNPHAGSERVGRLPPVKRSQRVLVIGGGPAGTEFAALAKQRGHRVMLWEREPVLGGQLAIAAKARSNGRFADWIRWQQTRLQRLAVTVELCHEATLADIEVVDPNVVVVATGAVPRTVTVPGIDLPFVHQAIDVLNGDVELGHHVVVVADDDSAGPLAVADHLVGLGHRVTLTCRTTVPSTQLDSYSVASILARLDHDGAHLQPLARLVGIEAGRLHLAHIYSDRRWTIADVDSVVLACGTVSDNDLHLRLKGARAKVHIIGDAHRPRRMAFATQQALQLVLSLD